MTQRRTLLDTSTAAQRSARFFVALALLVYEATWYDGEPRWLLIVAYGAMMGLPLANLADDMRTAKESEPVEREAGTS